VSAGVQNMTVAEAMINALIDAMEEDERVALIGRPLGLGPQRVHLTRLIDRFPNRCFDPPTSEAANAALGAGAAMAGIRPFVDLATGSFVFCAWSPIVNEAAVARYMTGGRLTAPVTYHCLEGVRGGGAPQHSHNVHAMIWNASGLEILTPSTPSDMYGLTRAAVASPNPSFIMNHAKLLGMQGPVERRPVPIGRADIKRAGRDVTIVAVSLMLHAALEAANTLASEGIEAEVLDPRTLAPLDEGAIIASVERTGRLVVVDEAPMQGGVASGIAGMVAERAFHALKGPVQRVARMDTPVAFSPPLEAFVVPNAAKIAEAARRTLGK
jgi:acetoin:2,6-dichlorophenolindophenol oxidoreductase subunit beta